MIDGSGQLTTAQADELLQRTTDPGWYAGMMATPDGQAILAGMIAALASASAAVIEQVKACLISDAPAGSVGTCTVNVVRPNLATTATIPRGYRLRDSRGVELVVSANVAVIAGQTAIALPMQTLRRLDLVNNDANALDDLLAAGGALDAAVPPDATPVYDSALAVLLPGYFPVGTFVPGMATYVSSTAITGAEMDWLSAHGDERGCRRQPGEDGEMYRTRMRAIPDAATPRCVMEAVFGALTYGALPITYMREPYTDQATAPARALLNMLFADSVFAGGLPPAALGDYCDDPFGVAAAGKGPFVTLECASRQSARAFFQLSVYGNMVEPSDAGMYSDVGFCDDVYYGFPDVGQDPSIKAALRVIQETADIKRAAGVKFLLYIENCTILHDNVSAVAPPGGVTVWTIAAAAGTAWMIREGLVGATGAVAGSIDPATDSFRLIFTKAAGGTITTPWCSSISGMPLRFFELDRAGYKLELITQIDCEMKSSVGAVLRVSGTFWTTLVSL